MAPEPSADRPYVFISYARADEEYVTTLVAHLVEHDIEVWIDTDIDYGTSWPRVIRDRVDGCAALVVVMTPTSDDSEWVRREFIRAEQQNKTILPLLLDGLPFFELNTTQYEDVTDLRMPSPRFVKRLTHLTSTDPASSPEDATVPPLGEPAIEHWLDEGSRLGNLDRLDEALVAFDRVIELDPNDAFAHANRGWVLGALGHFDEALVALDRAIELDPNNVIAHANRASALGGLGRLDEALVALDRAIELDPNNAFAHANRGRSLGGLGRHDEALIALDRAIELDPNDAFAQASRGWSLGALGRLDEALVALDRAIELDPNNVIAYTNRASALDGLGRHDEALVALDRAIELDPNRANAHANRGRSLEKLGRHDEAVLATRRAGELGEEHQ